MLNKRAAEINDALKSACGKLVELIVLLTGVLVGAHRWISAHQNIVQEQRIAAGIQNPAVNGTICS